MWAEGLLKIFEKEGILQRMQTCCEGQPRWWKEWGLLSSIPAGVLLLAHGSCMFRTVHWYIHDTLHAAAAGTGIATGWHALWQQPQQHSSNKMVLS
jgi:hypothetical protein